MQKNLMEWYVNELNKKAVSPKFNFNLVIYLNNLESHLARVFKIVLTTNYLQIFKLQCNYNKKNCKYCIPPHLYHNITSNLRQAQHMMYGLSSYNQTSLWHYT